MEAKSLQIFFEFAIDKRKFQVYNEYMNKHSYIEVCFMCCENHNCCEHDEENRIFTLIRLIMGAVLFFVALYMQNKPIFVISYIILGYDVVLNAIKSIKNLFNEHFLMTLATLGAFALGEFPEAVAVMLFYQIGEFLSDYAQDKAKDSIGALMDMRCDSAKVFKCGEFVNVPSEQVEIGEIIQVLPGEKIPLDGVIVKGSAYIDTKSLTGESVPRNSTVGDGVLSGFVVKNSVIEIEVTKKYADSAASKILALLSDEKKTHTEKFITRFAKIYTPIVVALAASVAVLPLIFGGDARVWLYRAILFLVVSCPCALVVSVPLTFFAGIGCASLKGILIKGASSLENTAKIKTIAFDKTGTLTDGKFCVRSVDAIGCSADELLKYGAYCEFYSTHPIASAIKEYYGKKIDESIISDYREIAGKGVIANISSHEIKVGSADFVGAPKSRKNAVFISIDGEYSGSIEICDELKPDTAAAISLLKKLGISALMLTGDSEKNAAPIANELAIPYFAELLPDKKVEKIKELQNAAFVGDGINDAPVLSVADVGISMGKIGSDAAIEASDVVLTSDSLDRIPKLLKISRKTMRIVYENVVLSILIKVLVMLLGTLGLATVWLAVFADVGVLILAVLNALRAFSVKD